MEYKSPQDSMNVDTFIKVIVSSRLTKENQNSFVFMKGEDDMVCKELLEFMKPEIDEIVRKNAENERKNLIMKCLKKNRTVEEIADLLEFH